MKGDNYNDEQQSRRSSIMTGNFARLFSNSKKEAVDKTENKKPKVRKKKTPSIVNSSLTATPDVDTIPTADLSLDK